MTILGYNYKIYFLTRELGKDRDKNCVTSRAPFIYLLLLPHITLPLLDKCDSLYLFFYKSFFHSFGVILFKINNMLNYNILDPN